MSVLLRKWRRNDTRFKTLFADSVLSLQAEQALKKAVTITASSPIHKAALERNIDKTIKADKLQSVCKA